MLNAYISIACKTDRKHMFHAFSCDIYETGDQAIYVGIRNGSDEVSAVWIAVLPSVELARAPSQGQKLCRWPLSMSVVRHFDPMHG